MGAVYTTQHCRTFGLADVDGQKVIVDKGPGGRGPEYLAQLTVYGLLHYLGALTGRGRYLGRDIVNDHSFADRVGLVVGVGFDKPLNRFALGLSFEIANGVNLVGAYDLARISELKDVAEGDVFKGKAEELPSGTRSSCGG